MKRIEKVREYLAKEQLDGIWVSNSKNLRYLANFTGSAGEVIITADKAYFITDFRYTEQAGQQAKGFEIVIHKGDLYQSLADIMTKDGIKKLAIEADELSLSLYRKVADIFPAELIETQNVIENIRLIKDEAELEILKEACKITDEAFDHILTFIKPGVSEIAVANELEHFLKGKGAEGMSFDTIVASGVRSAMPHGVASEKLIEQGDMVTLDFGCYYKGYSSDITRTIAVGEVDPKLKEIYQIVLDAHLKVIAEAKAGMTGKEIDAIARDYITEKGYGEYFGHSTGHGLGLDVHEQPAVSVRGENVILENMVITDEPGIYIAGLGGVRIEDDLIIHKDGVESINRSAKELIIL
ncbi:M24 family metallopeptidase [Ignavigranum ruoffiae]|uniref:M24 family metallopeptidase n=1 Tax=Ignavigranum ruoffiae TaxID=89093 RepID=UPI00204AE454|nr:aminopeptidase P family protein [Ignavigranum ruoffiae]UPQ85787.1 aminopeptidase P family protein [Ignavigranum ruoffiae]